MNDTITHMEILNNLDALLITNPINIRYLTGFVGAAPEERESYALITQDKTYLFINSLYGEQAKQLPAFLVMPGLTRHPSLLKPDSGFPRKDSGLTPTGMSGNSEVVEISREEPIAKKLAEILTGPGPVNRLGFEENNLTVSEYEKLKKELPGIALVPTQNRIEELRMIKRDDEIENIKAAAKVTDRCFDYILKEIKSGLPADLSTEASAKGEASAKAGITESEIAWKIETFIKQKGADLAFSPIVAFGPNSSQPHYSPSKNGALRPSKSNQSQALKLNDLVLLDFGAKVNGYCSDMTRMVFIGKPEAKWVEAYNTVLHAQSAALECLASRHIRQAQCEPGLERGGDVVDRIARNVIEKAGFPTYPHSLGHGVGLDIHEAPRLRVKHQINSGQEVKPGPSEKLSADMVVTIEPGIYIEGQYGIRIEDLILLKKDGIEILSTSDKQITIL